LLKPRQFIPVLIIAAGIWAYHNSFQGPFVFDDVRWIPDNPSIRHLWPIWKVLWPKSAALVNARPVVNLSLAVNYALGGTRVWGYHALNLTVHILGGMTLFGIVRRTLLRPKLRERFGSAAGGLALAVAVIWTVHPLQTESVTYIIQRAESIVGLFYLLTLYCFIRGVESPRFGLWYGLCVGACALGMASKEVMASAPLMVLLYDRAFVSGTFTESWRRHRRLYVGLSAAWVLLVLMVASARTFAQASVMAQQGKVTGWDYLATQPGVILYYLRLAVWPYPLCFDYYGAIPSVPGLDMPLSLMVIVILLAATAWGCKLNSAWGFLGAWFFLILAPSSSFVPLDSPIYEHRMYLSLAAVVTVVVVVAVWLGRRLLSKQQRLVAGWLAVTCVVVPFTFLTIQRNRDYGSGLLIWGDTVEKRPTNPRARNNLGLALADAGRLSDAVAQYELALRLNPDYAEAHNNLGFALMKAGRLGDALAQYEQALRLNPGLAQAHNNLGNALLRSGKVQEAIAQYELALRIKPDLAEAHNDLGIAFLQVGKVQEAIGEYERALEIKPGFAQFDSNLGSALLRISDIRGAIEHCRRAVELKPDLAEAHKNLGDALLRAGNVREAIGQYGAALRIKPDYLEAHFELGTALEKAGEVREAINHYEEALRIKPDNIETENNLAWLLATLAPEDGGDPVRGLELARRICELTHHGMAPLLDTLAAAYAATGQFSNAVAAGQQAIDVARSAGQAQVAAEIEPRLELYRHGRAYRQAARGSGPVNP
jgi:tetratricopeptide (TPR) repeat protein